MSTTGPADPLWGLRQTVGADLLDKIQSCRILVVGSGGIGCELLKDLALSGFRTVEVIDLDTIDVSNLNRQLLFRTQHVGQAKCTVACQVASSMVPGTGDNPVQYLAHHGNVCDNSKFNVNFVQEFSLVLNALDNVEARRRVNRLCLAADVPLIEAGTTGYLGQVSVIHKSSDVACYECKTQETQKVYPICTIRSTPSMPVHTIVWAKELYKLLFHSNVEESMLYEDPQGQEPSTYMAAVAAVREQVRGQNDVPVQDLLDKLFVVEIQKQLDMGRYKGAKKTPTVLDAKIIASDLDIQTVEESTTEVWTLPQCVAHFAQCIQQATTDSLEEFDKDDDLSMRFVTAASNLRSHVFGIEPLQSLYSAKGIAGNIIPAIATTNAICAGLQILQCFQILQKQVEKEVDLKGTASYINCLRNTTRNGLFLTASKLEAPNPNCFVCRNATIPLRLNVHEWTLERFLKKIVKARLGFEAPAVLLEGDFVWEEGDGADSDEFAQNLPKVLSKLPCGGIQHGTVLELDDTTQNLTIQVSVTHQDVWESEGEDLEEFPFVVGGLPPKATKEAPKPEEDKPEAKQEAKAVEVDDAIVLVIDDDEDTKASSKKRSRDEDGQDDSTQKKAKVNQVDVIEID